MAKSASRQHIEVEMSAVYTWTGKPPKVVVYEGMSLKGVVKNPKLPGFCVYYGLRPRLYAVGADFQRAQRNRLSAVEIVLRAKFKTPGAVGQRWENFAEASGELLDLRERRMSAAVTDRLREHFQTYVPFQILSEHPVRVRELVELFPSVKAFVFQVDAKDGLPLPVCWIRVPDPIVSIEALGAPDMEVRLPPRSWKHWISN